MTFVVVLAVAAVVGVLLKDNPHGMLAAIIAAVVGVIGVPMAKMAHNMDTQLLAGRVIAKEVDTTSCRHDYKCRCTKDRNGHETCARCYEHLFDMDYYVRIKGADKVSTECGDCGPPSWWSATNIGDPVAVPDSYQNYLLSDPKSLYIPVRPVGVSGARIPRDALVQLNNRIHPQPLILDGVSPPSGLSRSIMEWNADHGASKQTYMSVVLTQNQDPQYAEVLAADWLLGPKNSLAYVIGVQGDAIAWGRAVTFSEDIELRRWVRESLPGVPVKEVFVHLSEQTLRSHERTPMATLKHLEKSTPVTLGWTLIIVLCQAIVAGVTVLFKRE